MKGFFVRAGIFVITTFFMFYGIHFVLSKPINPYPYALAEDNSNIKQKGEALINNMPSDNLLILGSSELNMRMIPSHPGNLLANNRPGFTPNLVGRGSSQSIVHASILAATKNMRDKKVVILLSPQSYVKQGIMPDMYFANFSEQQFCTILLDAALPKDIKARFKNRLLQVSAQYSGNTENLEQYRWFSQSAVIETLSMPYIHAKSLLLNMKDNYFSYLEYKKALQTEADKTSIDWQQEKANMIAAGEEASDNNDFGFLNDYYSVNVGEKLAKFEEKDANLSYENSVEYDDLILLLDVCESKGIKPLVISVPMHGSWCDFTGFGSEEREKYYSKVKQIAAQYDVTFCDFSSAEYEPYFLCDVMHLGWIGWVDTNERINEFYYTDY